MDAGVTGLKGIKVFGLISVEEVGSLPEKCWKILIMGPTGAGKSTFIESLGWQGAHEISSGGLDGFTQLVTTYKLNNVTSHDQPIYLIDSPGFSDAKISELAIVSMVSKWLKDHKTVLNRVLFLTPITPVRIAGSQRQALKTFQILTSITAANQTTVVTTMWDTIWGESATQRAEKNFIQLQEDIWKVLMSAGSQIIRFHNTQASALSVLDQAISNSNGGETFAIETMARYDYHVRQTPFAVNVYTDLQDRVQNMHQERVHYRSALEEANTRADTQLESLCRSRLEEVERDLSRFQKELEAFGDPPKPLTYDPLVSMPLSGVYNFAIQMPLSFSFAAPPPPPTTATLSDDVTVPLVQVSPASEPVSSPNNTPDSGAMIPRTATRVEEVPSRSESDRPQRGIIACAIHSLKCWGKHHDD